MPQLLFLLLFLMSCFFPGCGVDWSCDTGEMRCLGDTVQQCNADRDWKDWLNCGYAGMDCYDDWEHCGGYGDIACCD